jgi:hypothetical protein
MVNSAGIGAASVELTNARTEEKDSAVDLIDFWLYLDGATFSGLDS